MAEAAQKDLRKRGKVLASKKSARTAAEGLLALAQTENKAALIELNCETDFVARNEIFQHLVGIYNHLVLIMLVLSFFSLCSFMFFSFDAHDVLKAKAFLLCFGE